MYKSKLQELCQQRSWELPTYESSRQGQAHNPRFLATVTVNDVSFHSPSPSNTSKKAQNDAAKLAFEHFSNSRRSPSLSVAAGSFSERAGAITCLPPGGTLQLNAQNANQTSQINEAVAVAKTGESFGGSLSVSTEVNSHLSLRGSMQLNTQNATQTPQVNEATTVARNDDRSGDMQHLFKSQLQTYAQKRNFALPVYSCERVGPSHASRFTCKVTVNGHTFESLESFPTLNKAEHAAAKAALMSLLPNGVDEDGFGYKNLLQELAQREGCGLPTYSTNKSGEAHIPTFTSTVEIEGEIFTGQGAKTKKQAEMSAAKTAYTALKQRHRVEIANQSLMREFHFDLIITIWQLKSEPQHFSPLLANFKKLLGALHFSPLLSKPMKLFRAPHVSLQLTKDIKLSSSQLLAFLQISLIFFKKTSNLNCLCPVNKMRKIEISKEVGWCLKEVNGYTLDTNLHALAIGVSSHHPFIASSGKYSGSSVTNIASSSGAAISSSTKHGQGSSSLPPDWSPRSAASSSIEHLVGRGTSSHSRNIIHPRGTTVTYPPGTTVLPISDDNWVAVKIPPQPSQ
ncbi:hypothetical protein OIU79_023807 [Salix purpurea]|uniref:DRBM domain-containing protein n=1 Tax=Salix purpurea TaxID=77065 RepID=A0A9Q1A9R8_SALPP|nr:hypothetical protein OIU79_023807 [Salix purpurea]